MKLTITIISLLLSLVPKNCFSQNSIKVGIETGFAKETFTSRFNSIGIGVNGSYWIMLSKSDNLTINSSYLRFFDFSDASQGYVNFIPIRVGYAKEIFKTNFGISGDIGIGILQFKDYNHYNLSCQVNLFYKFLLKNKKHIQVNWAYNYMRYTKYDPSYYYDWGSLGIQYGFNSKNKKK